MSVSDSCYKFRGLEAMRWMAAVDFRSGGIAGCENLSSLKQKRKGQVHGTWSLERDLHAHFVCFAPRIFRVRKKTGFLGEVGVPKSATNPECSEAQSVMNPLFA